MVNPPRVTQWIHTRSETGSWLGGRFAGVAVSFVSGLGCPEATAARAVAALCPGAPLTLDQFIAAIVTLLVVIDPPGVGLIFLALTSGMAEAEKQAVAVKASAIALAVLVGAALFGGALLAALGIGLPAFRIAGGLLLFAIAFEMVFEKRQERKVSSVAGLNHRSAIAAFPLAIPLIAGPGAITAAVLLAGRSGGEVLGMVLLLLTIAAVGAVTLATLLISSHLERIVSVTTQTVFARLTGVLLAALAVQFVIDGVRESVAG